MKKRVIKYLLLILLIFTIEINVHAKNIDDVIDFLHDYDASCGFTKEKNYFSGRSLKPGVYKPSECCPKGSTSLPHVTLNVGNGQPGFCVSCGSKPCRLCRLSEDYGNAHVAFPDYRTDYKFENGKAIYVDNGYQSLRSSYGGPGAIAYTFDGNTVDILGGYKIDCSTEGFMYADTNYENEKVYGKCRGYACEPVPLSVCWVKNTNGEKEYRWTTARPGGSEWKANFDIKTEETCGEQGPQYCYVKYGTGTLSNEYKVESSATSEWQKVIESEYGSSECNTNSICKKCNEEPRCYKDNQDKLVWGKYRNREGYTLQSDKSENECNSVVICDPTQTPVAGNNVSAKECEDNSLTKSYQTKISCDGKDMKGFYEIECTTTVKPTFDLENNGISNKKLVLYQGQGFGYGVTLQIIKKCVGKFNKDAWNTVYNKNNGSNNLLGLLRNEDSIKNENVIRKLEEKVNDFNNWTFDDKIKIPDIRMVLNTNPNVVVNKMDYNIKSNGTSVRKEGESVTLKSGTIVKNFTYTNEKNPMIINYYLPKVYLDKNTGEITNNTNNNVIDGGNKIYTNLDTEEGTYSIDIAITNFEDGKEITNDKCLIEIKKPTSLYRIIDVNNPFVNNTREKPLNWINETSDYSIMINGSTEKGQERINSYKKNPLYVFNLNKAEISEIKNSNNMIGNNYLGSCSNKEKDLITEKICSIINKK